MLFICLLLPALAFAQKKDTVLTYLDEELNATSKKNAVYYGVAINQGDHWMLYALYSDTTPVLKAWFSDRQLKIKDGPYLVYYPQRKKAKEGTYANNKMSGTWRTWYPNGQPKDSGLMKDNQMVGEWKTWYENGQLAILGNYREKQATALDVFLSEKIDVFTGTKDGVFTSWYTNGKMETTGFYAGDVLDSTWRWFHENGQPSTIEQYHMGKLASVQCFDTLGNFTGDLCPLSRSAGLQEYGDYKKFIYEHLLWPREAVRKGIEGDVRVRFTINKKGELVNLRVDTDQDLLKKAVLDLFDQMKEWYPAVSHNRVIDSEEEMIIPFRQTAYQR